MESFERAHVVKKSSKNDLSKKKQFRQMLCGYKQNNTDLIKHSGEIDDGSSSVSGFSDLNLTSPSVITDSNTDEDEYHLDLNSMSSFSEDFESISEQPSKSTGVSAISRKFSMHMEESEESPEITAMPSNLKEKKRKRSCDFKNSEVRERTKGEKTINDEIKGANSPPYVSVVVDNMQHETFDSIVGDYKHSIVKNLPCDSQQILQSEYQQSFLTSDNEDSDMHLNSKFDEIDNTEMNISTLSQELCDNTSMDEMLCSNKAESVEAMDTTFVNLVDVYYGYQNVIIVLKHPREIYIHGKVEVTRLGGTVQIFGYLLQNKPCEVFAPYHNFAHCLKTVENQNDLYGLFGKLTSCGLTVAEAEHIVTTLGEHDSVVCLKPLKSCKIEFVENNFTISDLFTRTNKNIDDCFKKASQILGCSLYLHKPWRCFDDDPKWHEVVKYGQVGKSKGIVCGGKGLGKSNFIRYYVNSLLCNGPVLVLDLDPGQAEFTVAGNISATVVTDPLIGPAFTHLKKPELMLNIGLINTMDNPKRYVSAVDTLITYCLNNESYQNMPWIVNTMGMVNGLGLKFMLYIILRTIPTFLFQIDSNNPKKNFGFHLTVEETCRLYYKECCKDRFLENLIDPKDLKYKFILSEYAENTTRNNYSLAPKDERYLNFLSYFSQVIKQTNKAGLLGITPYIVSLRAINIHLNVKVENDALLKVLTGKVVALCEENARDKGKVFTLKDKPIPCHGHGLIRGVDHEKLELFIITSIPVEVLVRVDSIVYADWVPEIRGQEKYLPEGLKVPYRTCTEYQQRQLMFPPRRRFNPIKLLKMSRNS